MHSNQSSNSSEELWKDWIDSPPHSPEEESISSSSEDKQLQIRKKSKTESQGGEEEVRKKWVELPPDVVSLIFLKLGVIDILFSAQSVCSLWRNISKEPHFWHSIHVRRRWDLCIRHDYMEKMIREAVDRSCGQLAEFTVEGLGTDELLLYIADRCKTLRCLRLVSCYGVSRVGLIEMAKKLPLLEELELCDGVLKPTDLEDVGDLWRQLKSFRLNDRGYQKRGLWRDEHALTIANSMPQLLHLHLFGSSLTDYGLKAILDGCPNLESLDLRRCFRLELQGDLLKRCALAGIRNLRLPTESTDDYEYEFYSEGSSSD